MYQLSAQSRSLYLTKDGGGEDEDQQQHDFDDYGYTADSPVTTPLRSPERQYNHHGEEESQSHLFPPIVDILMAVLRKSLVTCSVEREDLSSSMDIGLPTDVHHVSHVTFDRLNGCFLGLPVELQPELPPKVPSASISVFGVSANSMQCSHDHRGNSVPTILLMMQKRLYSMGGLKAEGIFRINADNSKEEYARNQLNSGVVAHGIDMHCLAGLIKAWFRELPAGILDSLSPEQVMCCNSEEECFLLLKLLPPTEAALLDWAINLMSDVVQCENHNKMNAHNISMVFAPNMTQMADPLTALIHAVQVMNFLKTLIIKTLREREESSAHGWLRGRTSDGCSSVAGNLLRTTTLDRLESGGMEHESADESCTFTGNGTRGEYDDAGVEGMFDRLSLKKGVSKLCRHPVFQLSKPVKKSAVVLGSVNNTGGCG